MIQALSQLFSSLAIRRAIRSACTIFLALMISYYFSRTHSFWLTIIAVLLMQTEVGFPLHQGLQRFFWIIILFFVGGQIGLWLSGTVWLPLVMIALVTLAAYLYASFSLRYLSLHFSLLALVFLLLTLLFPAPFLSPAYWVDIFIGATLGLGSTLLFFPDRADLEFPKRLAPLLCDLSDYLGALVDVLLRQPEAEAKLTEKRNAIERIWANKDEAFPVWVFEAGFNPALKPGQYFFVVHVGRVTEILFSMHYFASHAFPADLLQEFATVIRDSAERSQELMMNLVVLLEGQKLPLSETDFMTDLPALDEQFQSKIKLSLELLDISRDYVNLAAFIRYLKDLRLQLLQLAGTLSV